MPTKTPDGKWSYENVEAVLRNVQTSPTSMRVTPLGGLKDFAGRILVTATPASLELHARLLGIDVGNKMTDADFESFMVKLGNERVGLLYGPNRKHLATIEVRKAEDGLRIDDFKEIESGRDIIIDQEAESLSRSMLVATVKSAVQAYGSARGVELIIGRGSRFEKMTFSPEGTESSEFMNGTQVRKMLEGERMEGDPQRIIVLDPNQIVGFDLEIHSTRDPLFVNLYDAKTTTEYFLQAERRDRATIFAKEGSIPHDRKMIVLDHPEYGQSVQKRIDAGKSQLESIVEQFAINQTEARVSGRFMTLRDSFHEGANRPFQEMRELALQRAQQDIGQVRSQAEVEAITERMRLEVDHINEVQAAFQSAVKREWHPRNEEGHSAEGALNLELKHLASHFEKAIKDGRHLLGETSQVIADHYIAMNRSIKRLDLKGPGIDATEIDVGTRLPLLNLRAQVEVVNRTFSRASRPSAPTSRTWCGPSRVWVPMRWC